MVTALFLLPKNDKVVTKLSDYYFFMKFNTKIFSFSLFLRIKVYLCTIIKFKSTLMNKEDEDNLLKWLKDKDGVYNIREYFLK